MVTKLHTGIGFLLVGMLLTILITQTTVGTVCTNVGYHGEPPGGFEFSGIEVESGGLVGFSIVYTPDGGVNTCKIGLLSASAPVGLVVLGIGFVAASRKK